LEINNLIVGEPRAAPTMLLYLACTFLLAAPGNKNAHNDSIQHCFEKASGAAELSAYLSRIETESKRARPLSYDLDRASV